VQEIIGGVSARHARVIGIKVAPMATLTLGSEPVGSSDAKLSARTLTEMVTIMDAAVEKDKDV